MHLTKSIRQLVFELNRGAPDEFDANNPVSDVGLTSLSAAFASFGQGPQQRSSNPTMFYCAPTQLVHVVVPVVVVVADAEVRPHRGRGLRPCGQVWLGSATTGARVPHRI